MSGSEIFFAANPPPPEPGSGAPDWSVYPITRTPISLPYNTIIHGGTVDNIVYAAAPSDGNEIRITDNIPTDDELIGATLTLLGINDRAPVGPAVSIRGNVTRPGEGTTTILLQRNIGHVDLKQMLAIQRPSVTLEPRVPLEIQGDTTHGSALNLTLIGVRIAPQPGVRLDLIEIRAQCHTSEFYFRGPNPAPAAFNIHSNSSIRGGIEQEVLLPREHRGSNRNLAGVYIHGDSPSNIAWAQVGGVFGGNLVFRDITVRASLGGRFSPAGLEACNAPIRILGWGIAMVGVDGWGTPGNKARIRNVVGTPIDPGDGLRLEGSSLSCLGPINLNVTGCAGDGVRLEFRSEARFGLARPSGATVGGNTGLVGDGNAGFGINVCNGSMALVGLDTALNTLGGRQVALDSGMNPIHVYTWLQLHDDIPRMSAWGSLVGMYLR
jgi:hypothetical protein